MVIIYKWVDCDYTRPFRRHLLTHLRYSYYLIYIFHIYLSIAFFVRTMSDAEELIRILEGLEENEVFESDKELELNETEVC